MRASIIISGYTVERLNDIGDAIHSIKKQSPDDTEIILVPEDEVELVSSFEKAFKGDNVRIIPLVGQTGLTPARNLGIKESTGEIVVFLDDDAVPTGKWLSELLKPYRGKKILAVGGGISPEWIGKRPRWFPRELDWLVGCFYEGHPKKKSYVRNIIGANMSFRRQVFSDIGGFNTNIGAIGKKRIAGDDSEFCMRLREHYGPKHIVYIPDARVMHRVPPSRQTLGYCFRRSYVEGVSKAVISKLFKQQKKSQDNLDTEYSFLIHVLTKGLPSRLNPFSKKRRNSKFGEFIVLFSSTALVILGYMRGMLSSSSEAMEH